MILTEVPLQDRRAIRNGVAGKLCGNVRITVERLLGGAVKLRVSLAEKGVGRELMFLSPPMLAEGETVTIEGWELLAQVELTA